MIRIDSAIPPNGGAQNDSMVGSVQGSYRNEGRVQSCSFGADSTELPLSVYPTKTGVKVCVSSLSHHIPSEISGRGP